VFSGGRGKEAAQADLLFAFFPGLFESYRIIFLFENSSFCEKYAVLIVIVYNMLNLYPIFYSLALKNEF